MRQGPLAGRYPAVATMVVSALVPYLALSAAVAPVEPIIGAQLHMSSAAMTLATGLANAAYAIGTVFAVQFAPATAADGGCCSSTAYAAVARLDHGAAATGAGVFFIGHIHQGLCTSLMLIAARSRRLILAIPYTGARTAMILNVCIFGAVALGPFTAGVQAPENGWRPLFWIIAGIAPAALRALPPDLRGRPAGQPQRPARPARPRPGDRRLRAAFCGASELLTHPFQRSRRFARSSAGLVLIFDLLMARISWQLTRSVT